MNKKVLERVSEKINVKKVGGLIFALLLILTFVSKTIYNYNLPVVTAATPLNGTLNKTETVKGIAEWAETVEVYAETGGYVEEIFVKEGDAVQSGQALARLALTEEKRSANREKAFELEQLEVDIRNLEEDCSKLKTLFEEGAIAENEYKEKERELQILYTKQEKLLLDYQEVENSGSLMVYSPGNSVISEISVQEGQKISDGALVAICGLSQQFKINCSISLDNNFVAAGDTCQLENASHYMEGVVTDVTPKEDGKEVTVLIQSAEVMSGENFDVKFEKESTASYILVPNEALNMDSDGYFLYQVKQREGMLGKEFYVEKKSVYIGDNDTENTVISDGISFFEPIVLLSDKELEDGDIVMLENEGDFFAE